jgi:hypothetical protein
MTTLRKPTCPHGNTDECLACYDDKIAELVAENLALKELLSLARYELRDDEENAAFKE